MIKTRTFEDIAQDIQHLSADDTAGWFRVITETYLTPKDMLVLEAQKARLECKVKQRELSVIYCMSQPDISVRLRKFKQKVLTIYGFLTCDAFVEEYLAVRPFLSEFQYRLLSHVLAGYTPKHLAAMHNTTHVNYNICIKNLRSKLKKMQSEFPTLNRYLLKYKKNFA
jgi:hypothetical protein